MVTVRFRRFELAHKPLGVRRGPVPKHLRPEFSNIKHVTVTGRREDGWGGGSRAGYAFT